MSVSAWEKFEGLDGTCMDIVPADECLRICVNPATGLPEADVLIAYDELPKVIEYLQQVSHLRAV